MNVTHGATVTVEYDRMNSVYHLTAWRTQNGQQTSECVGVKDVYFTSLVPRVRARMLKRALKRVEAKVAALQSESGIIS